MICRYVNLCHVIAVGGAESKAWGARLGTARLHTDRVDLGVGSWPRSGGCTLHVFVLESLGGPEDPRGLLVDT